MSQEVTWFFSTKLLEVSIQTSFFKKKVLKQGHMEVKKQAHLVWKLEQSALHVENI